MMIEERGCHNCKWVDEREDFEACSDCKRNHYSSEADRWLDRWCGVDDAVNHPSHYETGKFECIEVMTEAIGVDAVKNFCLCNAFKYLYRCGRKNGLEDIKKAKWYIDRLIQMENENDNRRSIECDN